MEVEIYLAEVAVDGGWAEKYFEDIEQQREAVAHIPRLLRIVKRLREVIAKASIRHSCREITGRIILCKACKVKKALTYDGSEPANSHESP